MKVLLTTLNAKYIHSSLALRYLRAYCHQAGEVEVREFTINQRAADIAGQIYETGADVVGFACYLWNIEMTLKVASLVKKILPQSILVCGGPEVSYLTQDKAEPYRMFDYIVQGEGEQSFFLLLKALQEEADVSQIQGIAYWKNGIFQRAILSVVQKLDCIPFPYDRIELEELSERILYYESSRGCPFSCQYCLSSATKGVRFFSLQRVLRDLAVFVAYDVRQVKFVDRTFNARKDHFMPILEFIQQQNCRTNFHFEVAVDLLDEEALALLEKMPDGRVQLEVGIQSTHALTLAAVKRKNQWEKIVSSVKRLLNGGNMHLHLDLIVGLPHESFSIFSQSFNDVFSLRPHMLQIGFLKRLIGSGIAKDSEKYGYAFMDFAPYEVLYNNSISYEEIRKLHILEDVFEQYYNAGRFRHTVNYLVAIWHENAFAFFNAFCEFWRRKGLHLVAHTTKNLYGHLYEFCTEACPSHKSIVRDLLKFDALQSDRGLIRPAVLTWDAPPPVEEDSLFWREGIAEKLIRGYQFTSWRDIKKKYHIESFAPETLAVLGYKADERRKVLFFLEQNRTYQILEPSIVLEEV